MSDIGYRVVKLDGEGDFVETVGRFWNREEAEELAERLDEDGCGGISYEVEEFEQR